MSEMKVGDIGVLQNFFCDTHFNGYLAEIVGVGPYTQNCDFSVKVIGSNIGDESVGRYRGAVGIKKYNIRPITDPDAEKIVEEEMTA